MHTVNNRPVACDDNDDIDDDNDDDGRRRVNDSNS